MFELVIVERNEHLIHQDEIRLRKRKFIHDLNAFKCKFKLRETHIEPLTILVNQHGPLMERIRNGLEHHKLLLVLLVRLRRFL